MQAIEALGAQQCVAALPAGVYDIASNVAEHLRSDCGPVCVAQVVQKLEASRQRSSNWTVFEEFALLCEAWSRVARREPSAAFAFNGRSAKAVNAKLTWLKSILPPEIIDLPSCTPAELLGDTLAHGVSCWPLNKDGRS